MCVLIGLQVCFHSAMKHEKNMSNMIGFSVSWKRLKYTHC